MWSEAIITDVGAQLLASWVAGSALTITRAAAGTGTTADISEATALADEKQGMSIISTRRESQSVTLKLQSVAAETSYTMNQIGVWAKVDNGNAVLLAIYQDSTGIVVPAASTSQEWIYNFFATIAISNTGTLNVTIDTSAAVTVSTMQAALTDKQDKITATGMLKRIADGSIVAAQKGVDYDSGTGTYAGNSDTEASTALKEVDIDDLITLKEGALFVIDFDYGNTATNPYLKINNLAPQLIVSPGQNTLLPSDYWLAGEYCLFLWDGANFVLLMRFIRYIPITQKGQPGGVPTLAPDGKVTAEQLRGGFIVSADAPSDTSLLWIDSNRIMRFYDSGTSTWKTIVPTWG